MQKIYIMLSYTGTYFSTFLKFILREKYVHVSIALDEELKMVYSFGRKNPNHMFPCGFVRENVDDISCIFDKSICQIYELKVKKRTYDKLKKVIEKYERKRGELKYNVLGLPLMKFNFACHRNHHYVCSQFVGKVIQESKIYDFKKDYSLIKPNDVLKIDDLNLIYEGKIKNYPFILRRNNF